MKYTIPSKYKCYLKFETFSLSELLTHINTKNNLISELSILWLNPAISVGKICLNRAHDSLF